MKLLLLDIEVAPNTAYVWALFKQNITLDKLIETSSVLCWSAKWLGSNEVMFDSVHKSGTYKMLRNIRALLDEADAVIHYNGKRFDIPVLNKEFLLNNFTPPAPYKQIDLYSTVKTQFRFTSNKLDHVSQELGVGKKVEHSGFQMWVRCMEGDPDAWKEMEEYNKNDVILLEKVYEKLKPWIKGHINYSVHNDAGLVCPNCGGKDHHRRGFYYTNNCKYQRFRCNGCYSWFRGTRNLGLKSGSKFVYAG